MSQHRKRNPRIDLEALTGAPIYKSDAWWKDQPPEPLALTVKKFRSRRDQLTPIILRYLDQKPPTLEQAEQIDADMRRLGLLR